jgi:hypothetical protein
MGGTGIAGGTIACCRFVMQDPNRDNGVLQATANSQTLGISIQGSWLPPGTPGHDDTLAIAGGNVAYHGPGDREVLIELGANVTRGQILEPDANGRGVPAAATAATRRFISARALVSGSNGQRIPVIVEQYQQQNPA